jgi:Raf kinase inhibitor-like YbhB/YbcL family protein
MKQLSIWTLAVTVALGTMTLMGQDKGKAKAPPAPGLAISSPDFQDGGIIPNKFTQADPMPVSPKLEWTNVPANTQAFALIFHDPDVAIGGKPDDVLHWMVFNIPGTAKGLDGNQPGTATLSDGTIQAKNLRGQAGYMGPGNGAQNPYHHYTFELFALDAKLPLKDDASRADVLKAMEGHILGKGVLVGRFKRPQ